MDVLVVVVVAVAVLLVGLATVVWSGNRMLRNPTPGAGTLGNAFGGFDVFDPGQGRRREELDRHEQQGPVTPTPDDDDDAPLRITRNPDGSPRQVRIRRPGGRSGR